MPNDSVGLLDAKLGSLDMEPKTYSPMSVSDENMSSPPSVLTTASAGSCTPSSLPSAGSTPSSIQSAGSTPYQFISQEESTAIKPTSLDMSMTPSDHNNPYTPEPSISLCQPITPDPNPPTPYSQTGSVTDSEMPEEKKVDKIPPLSEVSSDLTETKVTQPLSPLDEERNDDCSCIMYDDSCTHDPLALPSPSPKEEKMETEIVPEYNFSSSKKKKSKAKKTYHSEISADPMSSSIKIKIKLTSSGGDIPQPHKAFTSPPISRETITVNSFVPPAKKKKSSSKGRGSKRKNPVAVYYDPKKRKKSLEPFSGWGEPLEVVNGEPQSPWGYRIPHDILRKIFLYAIDTEGSIPFLHTVSRVCRLWRAVSVEPSLWNSVDLTSSLIKRRHRTEKKLLWLVQNRFRETRDLNLGGWIEAVSPLMLLRIAELCPHLEAINLSFCYKLHAEYLNAYLEKLNFLQRIDISNIMGAHKPTPRSAVGQQTLCDLALTLKERLTHLTLANNTISNIPAIFNALSDNCPELEVLDISGIETVGRDSVRLNIEKLQTGCKKLRVLRLANSMFRLTNISIAEQVSSTGFPQLEELSVAVEDRVDVGINDTDLERILKNSNKLKSLDVRGCHHITDSSLIRIQPWDLEKLLLAGGSTYKSYSDRLELVIRKWQHSLRELDLSWTGKADAIDTALLALVEEKNDKLRSINLCGCSVSFEPIRKLISQCSSLQWINLTSCHALPRGAKRTYSNSAEIEKFQLEILKGRFDEVQDDN